MKTLQKFLLLSFCFLACQGQAQISIGLQGGMSKAWMEYGNVGLPEDATSLFRHGIHPARILHQNKTSEPPPSRQLRSALSSMDRVG